MDFAEKAIDNMNSNNVSNLNVIFEDYFNLDSKYNNTFDYFEYTFYCAINPSRRYEYIKKAYNLLSQMVFLSVYYQLISHLILMDRHLVCL